MGAARGLFALMQNFFLSLLIGGRSDSYAIHEMRRDVRSSIWVGRRGMEWILTCFFDIRDWVPSQDVLCKRFRDNGKLIEFCGRSNKAGLFVVIAVYFGGARRGCVMIPTSSNSAAWSLIQKELRNFLSGAKPPSSVEASLDNSGGVGQTIGSGWNGNNFPIYGNQWKLRNFEKIGTTLGHNVIHGDPIVNVSVINGRPMRVFYFKLTSANLALRICKFEGGPRVVTYLGEKVVSWPKDLSSGLEDLNKT